MTRYVSPNYIKASNIILVSIGLALVNNLRIGGFPFYLELSFVFLNLVVFVIALLIRKGYSWIKWVFAIITIVGLVAIISSNTISAIFKLNPISACAIVVIYALQLVAVVMLFIRGKKTIIDTSSESTII